MRAGSCEGRRSWVDEHGHRRNRARIPRPGKRFMTTGCRGPAHVSYRRRLSRGHGRLRLLIRAFKIRASTDIRKVNIPSRSSKAPRPGLQLLLLLLLAVRCPIYLAAARRPDNSARHAGQGQTRPRPVAPTSSRCSSTEAPKQVPRTHQAKQTGAHLGSGRLVHRQGKPEEARASFSMAQEDWTDRTNGSQVGIVRITE